MSSKIRDMCRSTEVEGRDDNLWNSCQNSSVGKFFPQNIWLFRKNRKTDSYVSDVNFHIHDRIPFRNFLKPIRR